MAVPGLPKGGSGTATTTTAAARAASAQSCHALRPSTAASGHWRRWELVGALRNAWAVICAMA